MWDKHQIVEEPYDGKLSRTVLKPSRGSDAPAQVNYHRKLKRLIAIELKLGKFKVEHKSQIELYLRWLDKHERAEGENSPMGILLCAEKSDSLVELLELSNSGIHIAQYLTELPDKKVLEVQLKKSIKLAKEKLQ